MLKTSALKPTHDFLIGCGGSRTVLLRMCHLEVEDCGCKVVVLTKVVNGQSDNLIVAETGEGFSGLQPQQCQVVAVTPRKSY